MERHRRLTILPIVQMALAAGLLQWSRLLERVGRHFCDMPGPDPAFKIMLAVSAPLSVPLTVAPSLWYLVGYPWNAVAWIAGVGLLWYWLVRSTVTWRERRAFVLPRGRYRRLFVDAALIVMALLLALKGVGAAARAVGWVHWGFSSEVIWYGAAWGSELSPSLLAACLYSAWCAFLLLVFGHDLRRQLQAGNL